MNFSFLSATDLHLSCILLKWDVDAALTRLLWAILCSFSTLPSCLWLLTGAILSVFATSCFPQPRCSPTHLQSVAPHCRSPQCHLPTPSAGPPEPRLSPPKPTPFLSGFQSLQTRGHNLKRKAQKIWNCCSYSQHLFFLFPAHKHPVHLAVIVLVEKENFITTFGCWFKHMSGPSKSVRW